MDYKQSALPAQNKFSLRDHHYPVCICQFFIIRTVLLIFGLCDKYVGQLKGTLQLDQPFKIVGLVPLNAKSTYQMQNQLVIKAPDFITTVFFRPEIAGDAKLVRIVQHDAGRVRRYPLGNGDVCLKPLLSLALKMDKPAHRLKKPPRNGNPQSKTARKPAASGVCLIKIIIHLGKLGNGHADACIVYVDQHVDTVVLPPVFDTDVDSAFFRKLNGVFQQYFQYMRNLFGVPDQHRRHIGIDIKHHFQLVPAVLHCRHRDHVIEYRGDHIFFLCRCQRPFHDLRVVHHIIDLVGQPLARHLYGLHIRPDLRGNVLLHGHLADSEHHVDGRPQLMRHIG